VKNSVSLPLYVFLSASKMACHVTIKSLNATENKISTTTDIHKLLIPKILSIAGRKVSRAVVYKNITTTS
jgi:hypothetical protein